MTKFQIKYNAFTLVEMLVVMAIFMILFGMSIAAFSGLRDTILVNENSQNFQQDIRWAQRAAILLKRESDEKWLYGIGIDIRDISTTGDYTLFKWCSPFNEYGDALTSSDFPNYDPSVGSGSLSLTNGSIDLVYDTDSNEKGECAQTVFADEPSGRLVSIEERSSGGELNTDPTHIDQPLEIGFMTDSTISDSITEIPAFIVFESVTGNTFFYNSSGRLLNYNTNTSPATNPVDVQIGIVTADHSKGTLITIHSGSGKVTTRSLSQSEIGDLDFSSTGFEIDDTDTGPIVKEEPVEPEKPKIIIGPKDPIDETGPYNPDYITF